MNDSTAHVLTDISLQVCVVDVSIQVLPWSGIDYTGKSAQIRLPLVINSLRAE